jgi:hypothetical protein
MAIVATIGHVAHDLVGKWYLVIPICICLYFLRNRYGRGLHGIPGPFLQSFSMVPRAWQVWQGNIHQRDLEFHQKYGKLVRIGPRLLSLSDVSEMNTVYGITTKFYKVSIPRDTRENELLMQNYSLPSTTLPHHMTKRGSCRIPSFSRTKPRIHA